MGISFTRLHLGLPLNSSPASVDVDPVTVAVAIAPIVENRAVIEQAKGVLMAVYDIDADSAFELLSGDHRTPTPSCELLQINS